MNIRSPGIIRASLLVIATSVVPSTFLVGVDIQWSDTLLGKKDGEAVRLTLELSHQADIAGLVARLSTRGASMRERHGAVIRSLRQMAAMTQPAVIVELEKLKSEGQVFSYQNYWISNIIEVICRADAVAELSELDGVKAVSLTPLAVPVEVVTEANASGGHRGAEPGPRVIGADSLWRLGITGAGRVGGHIDTGGDGSHPALIDRWRGNFEPPGECWLAPGTDFPFDSSGHGTATMGVFTGRDSSTGGQAGGAAGAWAATRGPTGRRSRSRMPTSRTSDPSAPRQR